jgi:UDP-N-acetyl-D-mannosaminuronate dehydrogenase
VTVLSKTVAVQGLGFVGAAMAVATAIAKQEDGTPWYRVVGVDLPSDEGKRRCRRDQRRAVSVRHR